MTKSGSQAYMKVKSHIFGDQELLTWPPEQVYVKKKIICRAKTVTCVMKSSQQTDMYYVTHTIVSYQTSLQFMLRPENIQNNHFNITNSENTSSSLHSKKHRWLSTYSIILHNTPEFGFCSLTQLRLIREEKKSVLKCLYIISNTSWFQKKIFAS